MFKKLLKKLSEFLDRLNKPLPARKTVYCPKCHSWNTSVGHYARGWNDYLSQACGDRGIYCFKCGRLSFFKSEKEYIRTLAVHCSCKGIQGKGERD